MGGRSCFITSGAFGDTNAHYRQEIRRTTWVIILLADPMDICVFD